MEATELLLQLCCMCNEISVGHGGPGLVVRAFRECVLVSSSSYGFAHLLFGTNQCLWQMAPCCGVRSCVLSLLILCIYVGLLRQQRGLETVVTLKTQSKLHGASHHTTIALLYDSHSHRKAAP